jgi:hypothetical protein
MGFALWLADGLAWAQGTHEYKPMGVAVISATDLFRLRDFHPARRCPAFGRRDYIGLFASVMDVNYWLQKRRAEPWRARTRYHGFFPEST